MNQRITTVDEALKYVADGMPRDDPQDARALELLAAEVERLRAENERQALDGMAALTKLREEAQTARLALDVALRALKWFQDRDVPANRLIDAVYAFSHHYDLAEDASSTADDLLLAIESFVSWSADNPPPGAAT